MTRNELAGILRKLAKDPEALVAIADVLERDAVPSPEPGAEAEDIVERVFRPRRGTGTRMLNLFDNQFEFPTSTKTMRELGATFDCDTLRRRAGFGREMHTLLLHELGARGLRLKCGCTVRGWCW